MCSSGRSVKRSWSDWTEGAGAQGRLRRRGEGGPTCARRTGEPAYAARTIHLRSYDAGEGKVSRGKLERQPSCLPSPSETTRHRFFRFPHERVPHSCCFPKRTNFVLYPYPVRGVPVCRVSDQGGFWRARPLGRAQPVSRVSGKTDRSRGCAARAESRRNPCEHRLG